MRLREHRELRRAWQLRSVPDHTTLYRFLKRLEENPIDQARAQAARRLGAAAPGRRRARVAVEATGLAQGAGSTFLVRRRHHHTGPLRPWRHGLQWLLGVAVDRPVLLSPAAPAGPWNDGARRPPLVEAARPVTRIGQVLAAAEFDRERNHTYVPSH